MSESTPTPGPWRATKVGASVLAGDVPIAFIPQGPHRQADANAIAAVPKLIETCKQLMGLVNAHKYGFLVDEVNQKSIVDNAEALIAGIEGDV